MYGNFQFNDEMNKNALIASQILLTTCTSFNPLKSNIKIQIVICFRYLFSVEVVGRIC